MAALRIETGLTFAAALLFAAQCLRTRRWLAVPATAWGALAFALWIVPSAAFPPHVPANLRAASVRAAREELGRWDERAHEVEEWRAGRAPVRTALGTWRSRAAYYVFGVPFAISGLPALRYEAHTPAHPLNAPGRSWARYGEAWAREVTRRREASRLTLDAAQTGLLAPPASFLELFARWLVCVGELAAVLLVYNALAIALGKFIDAAPSRATG